MQSMPAENELPYIMEARYMQERWLEAVSQLLHERIMAKSADFGMSRRAPVLYVAVAMVIQILAFRTVEQEQRIDEIQQMVAMAHVIASNGHRSLQKAQHTMAELGLRVLGLHRRKAAMLRVVEAVEAMREVVRIQNTLLDSVMLSDYIDAIMLCLECLQAAEAMQEYTCMTEIADALRRVRGVIGTQLDKVQRNMARSFDADKYVLVAQAYDSMEGLGRMVDAFCTNTEAVLHDVAHAAARETAREAYPVERNVCACRGRGVRGKGTHRSDCSCSGTACRTPARAPRWGARRPTCRVWSMCARC